MTKLTIREGTVEDAKAMAIILREIGWPERRNVLTESLGLEKFLNPRIEFVLNN